MGVSGSIQSAATTLTDWHVRGDDLIAVYETGQPDAARLDLLWHATRPATGDAWLARIDLLVSVRTDRLDWRHDVRLESILPDVNVAEKCGSLENIFAARGWSLALMIHPADLGHQELTAEAAAIGHPPFTPAVVSDRMVGEGRDPSRRARAWFLPAGVDGTAMAACFAEFALAVRH